MRVIVLGSAAGGGFPQWNCRCPVCRRAWAGDPAAAPRTQCGLAVSADGDRWLLLNAAPDLKQQILATPALHPREGARHSPIAAVALTGGDVDAVAGLLCLRESQPFTLYAADVVLDLLRETSVFDVLNPGFVDRRRLPLETPVDTGIGLRIEAFPVPGKVPLYREPRGGTPEIGVLSGEALALRVTDDDGRGFFFVPGCAVLDDALRRRLARADLVFFDGTLFEDDEMIRAGVGVKTGSRMGHMCMAGPGGSLRAFEALGVRRKVYLHVNNTNPVLLDDSPERRAAEAAGWEVAHDGMEVVPS